jgi:hypothetical protein
MKGECPPGLLLNWKNTRAAFFAGVTKESYRPALTILEEYAWPSPVTTLSK